MQTFVRGTSWETPEQRVALAESKPGTPIRFTASTEGVARDKMTIAADGWQLANYKRNPAFLWVHDYMGQRPPIGRTEKVAIEDGKLIAEVLFDQGDEFARDIERKYRAGFLNAVSVGWDTQEFEPTDPNEPWGGGKVLRAELLDISAVPIPGDPKALMERQKRALSDFGRDLLKSIEPEITATVTATNGITTTTEVISIPSSTARATWEEDAAAMAGLYRPFTQRPDDDRKAEHQRLSRAYGRHGKTPPEFVSAVDLEALTGEEIRGLFLENEPEFLADLFASMEVRAGKALSARNSGDLEQAITLIQGVLSRSQKEAESTDEERAADEALQALHSLITGEAA